MARRIAVYAGTFDPLTTGHADIIERTLALADELHIVVAHNIAKTPMYPLAERVATIAHLYEDNPHIVVRSYEGIVARYAQSLGEGAFLVRGIRSVADLERERPNADVNLEHFGIDTLFLLARPALSHVSSSLVRELATFHEPFDSYIP